MNEHHFRSLCQELVDENPFAVRAVLKLLRTRFTTSVPTLAVTCAEQPELLVNLDFVTAHCRTDAQIKAVITHEFLHVLLRHTEAKAKLTFARHIAFDAVINAIIHRTRGAEWSSLMSEYYADAPGLLRLLRPMSARETMAATSLRYGKDGKASLPSWVRAWHALYEGRLVADDITELAEELARNKGGAPGPSPFELSSCDTAGLGDLIGNHADVGAELQPELAQAIRQAMREMNGEGIWRQQPASIAGRTPSALDTYARDRLRKWRATTLAVLCRHLTPDCRSRRIEEEPRDYFIPVLSPGDRRAFLRTLWDPLLSEAKWDGVARRQAATAQVYLDVSGSMTHEMPHLIGLLGQLSRHIRRPFWAFSDDVAPARIEKGHLLTDTTGGTSMRCVLEHVVATRPTSAVVITDGFIEAVDGELVKAALVHTRLHVLVSRAGSPAAITAAGIPCSQIERIP